LFLEKIEDIFRTSLREIKSSSLIDSNFVSHREIVKQVLWFTVEKCG